MPVLSHDAKHDKWHTAKTVAPGKHNDLQPWIVGVLKKDPASKIMPLLFDFAGRESGRYFYKSTTASTRTPQTLGPERGYVRDETLKVVCSFLDIAHVTADLLYTRMARSWRKNLCFGIRCITRRGFTKHSTMCF
jgi:hypothetical protein